MIERLTGSETGRIDGVEYRRSVSYRFAWSDGGRSASRRPRQQNDCTVRAYAIAADLCYDDAYELLAKPSVEVRTLRSGAQRIRTYPGRKCWRGFDFRGWARGSRFRWISFPAVKGERRVCLGTVADHLPEGRYILSLAKHVSALVDGVVYDEDRQSPFRCVYGAWELKP